MTENNDAVPRSFLIIGAAALLWNLLGVSVFVTQITMTEAVLMALPDAQRAVYENMPSWPMATNAAAVTMSVLGCILLLLKRGLAVACFGLSLASLVVQMYYAFIYVDSIGIFGVGSAVVSTTLFVIAVALLWYSRSVRQKGWIN